MASYSSFAITVSDKDHEVRFFVEKNHDKIDHFGSHPSRTALALPGYLHGIVAYVEVKRHPGH